MKVLERAIATVAMATVVSACLPNVFGGYDRSIDSTAGRTRLGRLTVRWMRRLVAELEGPYMPTERAVPALDPTHDRIYAGSSAGALWAWNGAGTLLWMYQVGGAIGSQPLVDVERDEIYVASDDGLLHALVASTGQVRWRAEIGGAVGRIPVATEDVVYVVTDADVVVAFERSTGETLWQYRREAPEGFYITEHAGLAVTSNQILTGFTDGVVVALDPRDGRVLWERDTTTDLPRTSDTLRFTDVDTTPVVVGDTVFVASFAGGLYALERTNGSVRWRREDLTGIVGLAAAPGGLLIASSGDHGVLAVRAADGEPVWRHRIERGAPTVPVVVEDLVIVGESEGGLIALSLEDGTEVDRVESGHGFAAPIAVAAGRAAVLSNAGALFVLDIR